MEKRKSFGVARFVKVDVPRKLIFRIPELSDSPGHGHRSLPLELKVSCVSYFGVIVSADVQPGVGQVAAPNEQPRQLRKVVIPHINISGVS